VSEQPNPQRVCPLCGADNQCAVAAGRPVETCWCVGVELDAAALAAIPAASVGKHCICPACGRPQETEVGTADAR